MVDGIRQSIGYSICEYEGDRNKISADIAVITRDHSAGVVFGMLKAPGLVTRSRSAICAL